MITIKGVDPSMIANNLESLQPVHPGEMIKDEIECRGISQKKLGRNRQTLWGGCTDANPKLLLNDT